MHMASRKEYNYFKKTFSFDGRKYQIYGKTKEELIRKEEIKRNELQTGHNNVYNPTLFQYYEHMTEVRRNEVKESTIRTQKAQFMQIANIQMPNGRKFGDMKIQAIRRRNIEDIRLTMLQNGKTPQALNGCFAHLNHVFASAALDDTIEKNPCRQLKQLRRTAPPISETTHRALTIEETRLFFETAEELNSCYINAFKLMIKTGMRIGEVTALYPVDIDTKSGFIHVRRTITRNEIGAYIVGDDAKTASGKRDIPLTDELYSLIRKQKQFNFALYGSKNMDGLIFKTVNGEILREYTLNREIKRICLRAGIDYFTCHAFRNTFATRFIEQRPQDYKILSEILGHKDISITLNLYTHVMDDNKRNAMRNIEIMTG